MLLFDRVSASYGAIEALHQVSLKVDEGEIVSLIGANGAGKSTLLMTLCGDPRATTGTIHYKGESIETLDSSVIMRKNTRLCIPGGNRLRLIWYVMSRPGAKVMQSLFCSSSSSHMSKHVNLSVR